MDSKKYVENLSKKELIEYLGVDSDFDNSFGYENLETIETSHEKVLALEDIESLFEDESNFTNGSNINNIFLNGPNSNLDMVITNGTNFPNAFLSVSLVFSKNNISRILRVFNIEPSKAVLSEISKYGRYNLIVNVNELERIINKYIETVSKLNTCTLSYDNDAVASFIKLCEVGKVNEVVTYYLKKANAKSKRNTSTVGVENIMCNINVAKLREYCFGITPDCMSFNPHDDKELEILDYIKMCWELQMLLVFYKVCNISTENEVLFFRIFQPIISLAIFAGMRMFVELKLSRLYNELYEELKGFVPFNPKYLVVNDIEDKRIIKFKIKNSHFLNEAYQKEYNYPNSIPTIHDTKDDKAGEAELNILQGSKDDSVRLELCLSGQVPISRIYGNFTLKRDVNGRLIEKIENVNFLNMYYFGLSTDKPILYLFKQILNYSKDFNIKSHHTKVKRYLEQFTNKANRNIIPRYLAPLLLLLLEKPCDGELNSWINKYFKSTAKQQKAEFRKIFNDLAKLLQEENRLVNGLRKELDRYVW